MYDHIERYLHRLPPLLVSDVAHDSSQLQETESEDSQKPDDETTVQEPASDTQDNDQITENEQGDEQ